MTKEGQLIKAIDLAFQASEIDKFLSPLATHGLRASMIPEVYGSLTDLLPGSPAKRGETVVTNFLDAYRALDESARGRVDSAYRTALEKVPDEVKRKYPKVFPKAASR
jgi:hypothetical protein